MSTERIEKRIEALEREVRSLKRIVKEAKSNQEPWWEDLAGTFKDDPMFDEIAGAGKNTGNRCDLEPAAELAD